MQSTDIQLATYLLLIEWQLATLSEHAPDDVWLPLCHESDRVQSLVRKRFTPAARALLYTCCP